MGVFDSGWDALARRMDALVDSKLGDQILYRAPGSTVFVPIAGFVVDEADRPTEDYQDEVLGIVHRLKIAKATIPVVETATMRFQHPRLGTGVFRPLGALPDTQGRYWLIDVQKV